MAGTLILYDDQVAHLIERDYGWQLQAPPVWALGMEVHNDRRARRCCCCCCLANGFCCCLKAHTVINVPAYTWMSCSSNWQICSILCAGDGLWCFRAHASCLITAFFSGSITTGRQKNNRPAAIHNNRNLGRPAGCWWQCASTLTSGSA
jgi:hypothetical protein